MLKFIFVGLAVLGLLFYSLKKRKTKNSLRFEKEKDSVSGYGIEVQNGQGQLVDITERPVMILDDFSVTNGQAGSRVFSKPVVGVAVSTALALQPANDGKYIRINIDGNKVSWDWESARGIGVADAQLIVLAGGK